MPQKLDVNSETFAEDFLTLLGQKREASSDVNEAVSSILEAVRTRGDAAVLEYTERFDGLTLTADKLSITAEEIDAAVAACPGHLIESLKVAADRIRRYHERLLPQDISYTDEVGVELGARWRPWRRPASMCPAAPRPIPVPC